MKIINRDYKYRKELEFIPIDLERVKVYLELLDGEREIGIAVIWTNIFHPYADEIYIYIHDEYRRQGYGKLLLRELEKYGDLAFKCSVYDESIGALFLKSNGFIKKRSCWEFSVCKEQLIRSNYKELKLYNYSELSTEAQSKVNELIYHDYRENHEKISPMNKEICKYEWIGKLLNGFDRENSIVYASGFEFAYLILGSVYGKTADVYYVGGNLHKDSMKRFLYFAFVELFKKYDTLNLEIDDSDNNAMIMKQLFIGSKVISYDAYICK